MRIINISYDDYANFAHENANSLRAVGVEGFGIESGCIHLDYRGGKNCAYSDNFGRYIVFEWSKLKGSKVIY